MVMVNLSKTHLNGIAIFFFEEVCILNSKRNAYSNNWVFCINWVLSVNLMI